MKVTVTLEPHIGKEMTDLGIAEVEHDQWMVYATSDEQPKRLFMGYIGKPSKKNPTPAFNGYTTYRDFPDSVKELIVQELAKQVGYHPTTFEPIKRPDDEQPVEDSETQDYDDATSADTDEGE